MTCTKPVYLFASAVTFLVALATPALAQGRGSDADMRDKIIAKLWLGLGGEAEMDTNLLNLSGTDDLELSPGVAAHYEHPFNAYFVLGGMVALQSWNTDARDDAGVDADTLFDLSVLPKGRYALNDTVELYIALPLGLTFNSAGDDQVSVAGISADLGTGTGWNLSLLFGGQLAITDSIGLMGEMGYTAHVFSHTATVSTLLGNVKEDYDVSLGQFALSLGVYFAL